MKKLKIIFTILILIVVGFFAVKFILGFMEDARIKKIKEGWYVEVKIENLKIRKEPDRKSAILKEAKKGDVFKVDDYENYKGNYWYHIEYEKEKWGWIANPLGDEYLNDESPDSFTRFSKSEKQSCINASFPDVLVHFHLKNRLHAK